MITKPTLIIDQQKCRENINRMFNKAKYHNLDFRPHFKSHQSLEIGSWYKELGVNKITVSSVDMAKYFSEDWKNITIAFPVNILEIQSINDLASKIIINLVVENVESISFLSEHLISNVNVFLKIDVGYHRTGINPKDKNLMDTILKVINANHYLTFVGFLGHAGHTYKCRTQEAIKEIHHISLEIMTSLKVQYKSQYPNLIVSLGDTPSCSVAEDFTGVNEIRPGNFVFYDLTQHKIGSNSISQIAVAMTCPIVAIHEDRSEIVVYGGGVHFSKDRLEDKEGTIFGRVVEKTEMGWGNIILGMYVNSLSQEHGIISVPKSEINNYKIGDCLLILPIHSCMTANLMKSYLDINNKVITRL
ncbi:alanine racemase [Aquimarina megaterium]|nr:alanine racemase [Aquimarina megaterium]